MLALKLELDLLALELDYSSTFVLVDSDPVEKSKLEISAHSQESAVFVEFEAVVLAVESKSELLMLLVLCTVASP